MKKITKEYALLAIKKHLWGRGFKVEQVDHIPGVTFDILVDGKYRVIVYSHDGRFAPDETNCDIVAFAEPGKKRMYMLVDQPKTRTTRPSEIFTKGGEQE